MQRWFILSVITTIQWSLDKVVYFLHYILLIHFPRRGRQAHNWMSINYFNTMQKYLVGRWSREQEQRSTAEKTNNQHGMDYGLKPSFRMRCHRCGAVQWLETMLTPFSSSIVMMENVQQLCKISSCCIVATLITRNHLYKVLNFIHNYSHHEWTIYFAEDCQHWYLLWPVVSTGQNAGARQLNKPDLY